MLNNHEEVMRKVKPNVFLSKTSAKVYPLYTKVISDISNIYIINNEVYKNREDKNFNVEEEIKNYNNICIEDDCGYVDIFCSKEEVTIYKKIIEYLKYNYNPQIENFIKIYKNKTLDKIDK